METIELKAELVSVEEKRFIHINADPVIRIPISDDNPKAVKSAFCKLIQLLKGGPHSISLEETKNDLFYQVATSYIGQLNGELATVYDEMKEHGFVDSKCDES